ncbi:MAG: MepB family protein [Flavobacteriaceae bacterium]|nr:MepB family protein [Flavobacteriaceae bacterium]
MNKPFTEIYQKCNLKISNFKTEPESKEYEACHFEVNGQKVISRNAKITSKKVGQFVTFWKRNKDGITQPFFENDNFHFYVITVNKENRNAQFVFPKSILIAKGIVSTQKKDGERGFRVYPIWDTPTNKQAEKTQQWQLDYFFEIAETTDFKKVKKRYSAPI